MKRLLSILCAFLILIPAVFADENENEGDQYDDGYVYDQNGSGDQFLKFDFSGCFPITGSKDTSLIHSGQLDNGFAFDIGYYRFLTNWFAVGGEITFTSNWSIGEKLLTTIPICLGVCFQPSVGKFEFPIYADAGVAYHSWANNKYFPALTLKSTAGVFYRITESWSAGVSGSFFWEPEWYGKDTKYTTTNLLLTTINIGGRFHF